MTSQDSEAATGGVLAPVCPSYFFKNTIKNVFLFLLTLFLLTKGNVNFKVKVDENPN